MANAYIGTSGWSYKGWTGSFFPPELKASQHLGYYQERFNTVEINLSHYRLPKPKTVQDWARCAPPGFRYAYKASRFITHMKKLKDPETAIERFMALYLMLGESAGPVLLQLPPRWVPTRERLEAAIIEFYRHKPGLPLAVEFRDRGCYNDELIDLLNEYRASLVVHDMDGSGVHGPNAEAPFVFKRYHGAEGKKYAGNYSDERLAKDAKQIKGWLSEGRDVYAYFNNDAEAYAPWNALTLRRIVVE